MATIEQIMNGMAANYDSNVKDVNATIQFNFSGGEPGSWVLDIANGQATAHPGTVPNPRATLSTASETWQDIIAGRTNPTSAFMTGKVKAQGDMTLLMRLQSLFKA